MTSAVSLSTCLAVRRTLLALVVAILVLPRPAVAADSQIDVLKRRHAELQRSYAESLADLAREFEALGALDAAAEAWRLAIPPDPQQLVIGQLPSKVSEPLPATLPAEERALRTRFRQKREEQSTELYLLSRQALTHRSVQYAFELLREAAVQDPDNATARRILGFIRVGDEWMTPFEARMRRTRQVWHEKYGWLPADHVQRYEAGQRYSNGRWISAEADAEQHRDFSNPWVVETEHYRVKTNHSLERGVEVASRLEMFHGFFVETFAGFFTRPEDLQILFRNGTGRTPRAKLYEVHYYRTRDEYNQRLVKKEPKIALTNGLYFTDDRIAYFFHDDELTRDDTLYHEATHQLMYECLPRDREVANQAHFWIIEGIACYMESFRSENGKILIGDPNHPRIQAARYRYLTENHYVPLGRFASMGLMEFQSLPFNEMQRNYSQAAGLAHFFMHEGGGRYRGALIEHLAQLYHGVGPRRRPVQNLAELTGVAYATLDQQYGEYMKSLGEPRAAAASN